MSIVWTFALLLRVQEASPDAAGRRHQIVGSLHRDGLLLAEEILPRSIVQVLLLGRSEREEGDMGTRSRSIAGSLFISQR